MSEKVRVLIVDDDKGMNRTISLVLKRKGYEIATADNGLAAIELVKKQEFDIIFMDIRMPLLDGVETLSKIRKIHPDIVVMMMTAYAVEDLIQRALQEGAYGIIYKPLDIEKILSAIQAVMKRKEGMLILVVDDDPGTTTSLRIILENLGHHVGTAHSGEEALRMAAEKTFEILFVDMKLPTMNGLQTYIAMKQMNEQIIAVIITGYKEEMASLIDSATKESAYSVLYKPFEMESLLTIISEIERKKRAK